MLSSLFPNIVPNPWYLKVSKKNVKSLYSYKYTGIIPRDKTMADKLLYIPNDDKQKYPFSKLQLIVEMFEHST